MKSKDKRLGEKWAWTKASVSLSRYVVFKFKSRGRSIAVAAWKKGEICSHIAGTERKIDKPGTRYAARTGALLYLEYCRCQELLAVAYCPIVRVLKD